jgi:hypothetical protein
MLAKAWIYLRLRGIDLPGRLLTRCETASMVSTPDGNQFHFDPATYLEMIRQEVPAR